jgi:hypothetical protein
MGTHEDCLLPESQFHENQLDNEDVPSIHPNGLPRVLQFSVKFTF